MYLIKTVIAFAILLLATDALASETQLRIDRDIEAGKPVVIHISVALADNKHQWIARVPEAIGNGQDARTNLYWGALYGVKTFLIKKAGWEKIASVKPEDDRILERLVLKKSFLRNGNAVPVYLVADAWDGRYISETIEQFLRFNAGEDVLSIDADGKKLDAGGRAHMIVYMGHNALMDYGGIKKWFLSEPETATDNPDNDAVVLACKSRPYFAPLLEKLSAHPLLLTTGLMAPEAYTLNAAIEKWIAGAGDVRVRKAAAASYAGYQKIGIKAAERLFGVGP